MAFESIVIEVCSKLNVSCCGGLEERLHAMVGSTVEFVGRMFDDELVGYCAHAKVFLLPGNEDFGLAPLEAMASDKQRKGDDSEVVFR